MCDIPVMWPAWSVSVSLLAQPATISPSGTAGVANRLPEVRYIPPSIAAVR